MNPPSPDPRRSKRVQSSTAGRLPSSASQASNIDMITSAPREMENRDDTGDMTRSRSTTMSTTRSTSASSKVVKSNARHDSLKTERFIPPTAGSAPTIARYALRTKASINKCVHKPDLTQGDKRDKPLPPTPTSEQELSSLKRTTLSKESLSRKHETRMSKQSHEVKEAINNSVDRMRNHKTNLRRKYSLRSRKPVLGDGEADGEESKDRGTSKARIRSTSVEPSSPNPLDSKSIVTRSTVRNTAVDKSTLRSKPPVGKEANSALDTRPALPPTKNKVKRGYQTTRTSSLSKSKVDEDSEDYVTAQGFTQITAPVNVNTAPRGRKAGNANREAAEISVPWTRPGEYPDVVIGQAVRQTITPVRAKLVMIGKRGNKKDRDKSEDKIAAHEADNTMPERVEEDTEAPRRSARLQTKAGASDED